jgi:guanylate kinase
MEGKAVIVSAPSGAGKTTIVKHLLHCGLPLEFSVSACSRDMRPGEVEGKDYYFLGLDEFKKRIACDEFIEWEEVYNDMFYGTLKSEISRIWALDKHVIFDVDVKGGVNLKKQFGKSALSIFISPPTFESLRERLIARDTESAASLEKRLERAKLEIGYASQFDITITNDVLSYALEESEKLVRQFIFNAGV